MSILLFEKYKQFFLDLFKEKLFFLDEKYLDNEISQKIIQNSPAIENIVSILNQSKDYNSYIKKIKDNLDQIYKAIKSLKSLKGIFQADFEVSQANNINEFSKLHKELLEAQERKGIYIISFFPIIKKYYDLFNQYNNLEGLCELFIMMILEFNKFPSIKNIKLMKNKISEKIKELLKSKFHRKEFNGKDFVKILSKLREVFDDGNLFDKDFKIKIFKYFIIKCKGKESEVIKAYKKNRIYELFRTEKNKIDMCYILKDEDFDVKDHFMDLLPDELDNNELDNILYT